MFHYNAEAGFVDGATWAVILNDESIETQLHETAHFWQAISTRFMYWFSVSAYFKLGIATRVVVPGLGIRDDILRPLFAVYGQLHVKESRVSALDVIEGHAEYLAYRTAKGGSHDGFQQRLREFGHYSEYRAAYEHATARLGAATFDAFGPLCFVALQDRAPGIQFERLVDWLAEQPEIVEELAGARSGCHLCGREHASMAEVQLVHRFAEDVGPPLKEFLALSVTANPTGGGSKWRARAAEWVNAPEGFVPGDAVALPSGNHLIKVGHPILDAYLGLFLGVPAEFLILAFARPYRACTTCGEENDRYSPFSAKVFPPLFFFNSTQTVRLFGLAQDDLDFAAVVLKETVAHGQHHQRLFDSDSYDAFLQAFGHDHDAVVSRNTTIARLVRLVKSWFGR